MECETVYFRISFYIFNFSRKINYIFQFEAAFLKKIEDYK